MDDPVLTPRDFPSHPAYVHPGYGSSVKRGPKQPLVPLKERLRVRAAEHGHSMEAEVRRILQTSLKEPERPPGRNLYERIRARFELIGGADDLELPPRLADREPPPAQMFVQARQRPSLLEWLRSFLSAYAARHAGSTKGRACMND